MQQINKIGQPFPEILVIYFVECWACPGMPHKTDHILYDLIKASMDIWLHAKKEDYTSKV